MKAITLAIVCSVAALLGGGWASPAMAEEEVTGLNPSISGTVGNPNCAVGIAHLCADTFLVKCLQSSRYLTITVHDTIGESNCIQMAAVGLAPTSMLGDGRVQLVGACTGFTGSAVLIRPTSGDGTMKALALVWCNTQTGLSCVTGDYSIEAKCETGLLVPRTTSLTQVYELGE